jgi:penicillin G amidase
MRVLLRILRALLALVLVLVVITGGAAFYFVRQSWPRTSGSERLAGLGANVEVIRDAQGVPHIYADTTADLFMAQGWVHAQDRFFQMEFWRRIGQGRIAELFGKGALNQDRFIRTVGWHEVAKKEAEMLPPDVKAVLESYAGGVNAYTAAHGDALGLEFKILGLSGGANWTPEPWTLVNSLTWGKAMSFNLADNGSAELLRAALIQRGGAPLAEALLPPYPADMPVIANGAQSAVPASPAASRIAPSGQSKVNGAKSRIPPLCGGIRDFAGLPLACQLDQRVVALVRTGNAVAESIGLPKGSDIGSNNWVLAGSKTSTGKAILANDPHLGIQMPSIWYQVGLHCRTVSPACPFDVTGFSFAGTPGVVIGHNARIAWGVTNATIDTQDYFIEKPDPNNADAFEFMGKFEAATVREEQIRIAGQTEPVPLRVRSTRHGPIMNDVDSDLKDLPPMAMSWAALQPGTLVQSILAINTAQNWDEFRSALKYWDTPAQNFVYADVDGNIGYQLPGRHPIRTKSDGTIPVEGWTGENEWSGWVPYEQLPTRFNPPEGFIVTANNAIVDSTSQVFGKQRDWDHGYRAKRIVQMIQAKDKHSVDDIKAMHFDSRAIFADELLPELLAAAENTTGAAIPAPVIAALKSWDKRYTRESQGALIYEAAKLSLARAVFADDTGTLAADAIGVGSDTQAALSILLRTDGAPWWDDTGTPAKETRPEMLRRALEDAVKLLSARFGTDISGWRWGAAHVATFKNQTLGQSGIAPIERIFNRGPYPAEGGTALVNAVGHSSQDFSVRSLPSLRMIVDMGDFERSQAIHTTGQSGHAFHPNYDDMIQPWLDGRYNTLHWSRAAVDSAAAQRLTLTP